MQILAELYQLTQGLNSNNVDYAVCGGLAMAVHGRPRLTVDIDIVVAAEQVDKVVEIAVALGFDDKIGWIALPSNDFGINRLFRLNKYFGNEYMTLDILEADSAKNAILLDRLTFEVDGHKLHSLSRAALIKMKRNSNRTKDKLDVELLEHEAD